MEMYTNYVDRNKKVTSSFTARNEYDSFACNNFFKVPLKMYIKKVPFKDIFGIDAIAANIMSLLLFRDFKYF